MFDCHTHVIPGVDDGASSLESACAALRALGEQGVETVVATPHVDGSLTLRPDQLERRLAAIDAAWESLVEAAADAVPEVRLRRGAEIMLDAPRIDFSDERVRLGGGPFVLVEFAGLTLPPAPQRVLADVLGAGYTPVLAHPERYTPAPRDLAALTGWREAGALLQVNCGSLLAKYGERARSVATALLEAGLIDCLASDHHARGVPALLKCAGYLDERGASEQRELLLDINPRRVLDGIRPLPVPPVEPVGKKRYWLF